MGGALANLSGQGAGAGATPLGWALAASLALHAALLAGLPDLWTYSPQPATAPLNARLAPALPPGAQPAVGPEPRADGPPPAEPPPAAPPKRLARLPAAAPSAPRAEKPALEPAQATPPPGPAVATAQPPVEPVAAARGALAPGAAIGEPTLAPRAGEDALDLGSLAQYRLALIGSAKRHRLYPPYAIERGWHGRVGVHLAIGADGALAAAEVRSSSGHAVLDAQAVEMLRKAAALTPLPPALRSREFTLEVPVVFELRGEP